MVATRAAVDRCGPGHVTTPLNPTGTEEGQDRGGARDELHGYAPEDALPQAAGTVYYPMDVDDVPASRGSRPDRLLDVSGPQERVQRRTVQQIVDSAPVLPLLHDPDPVPQMVDSVEEVRCFFLKRWPVAAEQTWDCEDELVFEMPKILVS